MYYFQALLSKHRDWYNLPATSLHFNTHGQYNQDTFKQRGGQYGSHGHYETFLVCLPPFQGMGIKRVQDNMPYCNIHDPKGFPHQIPGKYVLQLQLNQLIENLANMMSASIKKSTG